MFNTLYHFVHRGPLRIAVDDARDVINEYSVLAKNNQRIQTWISDLANCGTRVFDYVPVKDGLSGENLYLEICRQLPTEERKLLCDSKHHYHKLNPAKHNVQLFDLAEAENEILAQREKQQNTPKIVNNLVNSPINYNIGDTTMNDNSTDKKVTMGNQSPIGDHNVIASGGGGIRQWFRSPSFIGGIVTGMIGSVLAYYAVKIIGWLQ